jgi:hypothetical protein
MSLWNFRLAEPRDAEAFAKWVTENPQIDPKDVESARKVNSPTVLTFVAEKDGVPIAFAPLHLVALLDHLAFSSDARASEKMQAMDVLKDGVSAFMVQFGIREIHTLSREGYPVAQWALKHGFDLEPRQLLRLDLNKILAAVEEETKCAQTLGQ